VVAPGGEQRIELRVLARQLEELGALGDDVGRAEQRRDFLVAPLERRHLVDERGLVEHGLVDLAAASRVLPRGATPPRLHSVRPPASAAPRRRRTGAQAFFAASPRLYFLLKRSMRPAVSISFCLPVKNGWQFEQMSTEKSPRVLNVSWTIPHAQVIFDGR